MLDLHMHSNISLDGEFSPERLAALCREHGMKLVSLTDHNSVRGILPFMEKARECGITVLPGVELDCTCDGLDLHLLGYGIDVTDKRYLEVEEEILEQKRASSRERMNILSGLGICFDEEKVLALAHDGIVVGEMIAEAALADERNMGNPILEPYRKGGARGDNPNVNFFWDFCSQGKPAFLPVRYMEVKEAVTLIRDTGGFSVIAHPAVTVGRREQMISSILELGASGIEVFSSYHRDEDIRYYRELADRYGVLKTAGSDFHGRNKPAVRLGDTNGMTKADEAVIWEYLDNFRG